VKVKASAAANKIAAKVSAVAAVLMRNRVAARRKVTTAGTLEEEESAHGNTEQ
jgi:putative intracellular protease/amidase